jgi:DNA-binding NarL/FixJ family response regulator
MIKVLIVDDHKILRDGIKALLKGNKEITVVGECEDGNQVLQFLNDTPTDVVLMDIMMENVNGIETTRLLKEYYPDVKVIAVSMHNDYSYIQRMLEAGANGYVLKNTSSNEMVTAIIRVFEGKTFFTQDVTDIVMKNHMTSDEDKRKMPDAELIKSLTRREIDVLKLIADEYTNNEIAEKLFISRRTVDTHRRNLLQKIGAKNSIGLIRFAYSTGLID